LTRANLFKSRTLLNDQSKKVSLEWWYSGGNLILRFFNVKLTLNR
jgi:hypothetical protein